MVPARVQFPAAILLAAIGAIGSTRPALAHATGAGFVLLLPTGNVILGGALAVALSVALTAFLPDRYFLRLSRARLPLVAFRLQQSVLPSLMMLTLLALLLVSGWFGIRDPLANPLPLAVWTVWWVGFPLLHILFGDLWSFLNPFTGLYRLLNRWSSGRLAAGALTLPDKVAYWPALLVFFLFAWFELIYPAPDDPERLASVVAIYMTLTFALLFTYGEDWLQRADPFAVFFRLIARLSPFVADETRRLTLIWPTTGLLRQLPLPISGILFVLLTLSSVSFDGLSKTFSYLTVIGINPLEFPGRSAVVVANTIGLVTAFAILSLVYLLAVRLGQLIVDEAIPFVTLAGALVLSLVPISIAFHGAHYLTILLINGQYVGLAANDPFGLGWDLFGLRNYHVTTSFMSTRSGSITLWAVQTGIVVTGHLIAVLCAHNQLIAILPSGKSAFRAALPLSFCMVLYTIFGLWLLASPTAA